MASLYERLVTAFLSLLSSHPLPFDQLKYRRCYKTRFSLPRNWTKFTIEYLDQFGNVPPVFLSPLGELLKDTILIDIGRKQGI